MNQITITITKNDDNNTYDVSYIIDTDGDVMEITGSLLPFETGRETDYSFSPDTFLDTASEEYYDENWEEIEEELQAEIGKGIDY